MNPELLASSDVAQAEPRNLFAPDIDQAGIPQRGGVRTTRAILQPQGASMVARERGTGSASGHASETMVLVLRIRAGYAH